MIVGYAFVVGDLLHIGHLKFLQKCKECCDFLIVGVYTDELTQSYKRKPIIPFEERIELIRALKSVDMVIKVENIDCTPTLLKLTHMGLKASLLFHGDNWKEVKGEEYIKKIGGKLIQFPYYQEQSTTLIIKKIRNEKRK